jgi:hypothetical protein
MLIGSLLCWVRKDEGMIKPVLGFVGFFMVAYLAVSFITWEMNPYNWSEAVRAFLVVIGSFGGVLMADLLQKRQTYYE